MNDQPDKTPRKRLSRAERAEAQAKDEPKSWGGKHNPDEPGPADTNERTPGIEPEAAPEPDPSEYERGFKSGRRVGRSDAERDMRATPTYGNTALLSLNQEDIVVIALQRWQVDMVLYGLGTRLRDHMQGASTLHPGVLGAAERSAKCIEATIGDISTQVGDVVVDHLPMLDRLTIKPQRP